MVQGPLNKYESKETFTLLTFLFRRHFILFTITLATPFADKDSTTKRFLNSLASDYLDASIETFTLSNFTLRKFSAKKSDSDSGARKVKFS